MDDKWLAVDLIHAGEEDVALAMMSGDIPEENGFDLMRWARLEVLTALQDEFRLCLLMILWIFL